MKNSLLLFFLLSLSIMACKEKKTEASPTDAELQETIKKVEQENEALKSLDTDIEADIKALDDLLKEVDEN